MDARAGRRALESDLVDLPRLLEAYTSKVPDVNVPSQKVVFGTSGHRGSSLDAAFNEAHIVAITQAIVEYRTQAGYTGTLYIGRDTHALSLPAWQTALEVLTAAGVDVRIDNRNSWTPTPAISLAILKANDGRTTGPGLADGIVVTPSHNPPRDGGFKYNGPDGGPAGSEVTSVIAQRANEILAEGFQKVRRLRLRDALASDHVRQHDYLNQYVDDLPNVVDIAEIRRAGVRIGVDPLGGASLRYWARIAETHDLNLTIVNPTADPRWGFMTLDWDGKIRMDCSSPYAMASLLETMGDSSDFDIAIGNDADADRHGIVTPNGGLLNPNHFLAVAIDHLFGGARPNWPADAAIGKTLVSSMLIDRVAADRGKKVVEVPVGFKWFVPGLLDGSLGFGGEESAGASLLRMDGTPWTTDKDGIVLGLLAAEITATGHSPSDKLNELIERHGRTWYARIDAAATPEQKARLAKLSPEDVTSDELAGQPILQKMTNAPGNDAAIGGLKVTTADAWFAARPSGTEDVYKIYAESAVSAEHLAQVQSSAKEIVSKALD